MRNGIEEAFSSNKQLNIITIMKNIHTGAPAQQFDLQRYSTQLHICIQKISI
jgi:hypothetical protein